MAHKKSEEGLAFTIPAGDQDCADVMEFYAARLRQRGDEDVADQVMAQAQEFREHRAKILGEDVTDQAQGEGQAARSFEARSGERRPPGYHDRRKIACRRESAQVTDAVTPTTVSDPVTPTRRLKQQRKGEGMTKTTTTAMTLALLLLCGCGGFITTAPPSPWRTPTNESRHNLSFTRPHLTARQRVENEAVRIRHARDVKRGGDHCRREHLAKGDKDCFGHR